jgi:hypothetical protein
MQEDARWLLLVFTLPTSKASERVQIWRKSQKFGAIAFRNAGSLLPNTPENQERFEWLARTIRASHGEASILQIQSIDDLPSRALQDRFRNARAEDYTALIEDLQKLKPSVKGPSSQVQRLRRRFEDIVAIDFFTSPLRVKAEEALTLAEGTGTRSNTRERGSAVKAKYQRRTWITRPRPGIDRVSSAWLISRFIDAKPRFIFGTNPALHKDAIPFDMFQGVGFGHEGDRCTFETLCVAFDISDHTVLTIEQAIHDADLEDGKFGRSEGHTLNQILRGWAAQNVPDDELLRRGMDLIEGFYHSISRISESLP